MSFCVLTDGLISSDRDAFTLASQIVGNIAGETGAPISATTNGRIDDHLGALLIAAFPEGGGGRGLTFEEIAQTVLHDAWSDLVNYARDNDLALQVDVTEDDRGGGNVYKCWAVSTRPLTSDELGSEQDANQQRTPNPFDLPDLLKQPTEGSERDKKPTQNDTQRQIREEPLDTIPNPYIEPSTISTIPRREGRTSPPSGGNGGELTPQEQQERDNQEQEEERNDDSEGDDNEEPIPDDITPSELSESDVPGLLEAIRKEVERQGRLGREVAGATHAETLESLTQIEQSIDALQGSYEEALQDLAGQIGQDLDNIGNEMVKTIKEESDESQGLFDEFFQTINELIDSAPSPFDIDFARLIDSIQTIPERMDIALGRIETELGRFGQGLIEEIKSDARQAREQQEKIYNEVAASWNAALSLSEGEIVDSVCSLIKFYQGIATTCNLKPEGGK